jgi:ribosomal protein S18 acetylase RimI-like enzyme
MYRNEKTYDEGRWRAEFTRGDWYVGIEGEQASQMVSLVGVTREPGTPTHERFLEYLWVDPGFRRRGIASGMIRQVLDRLKQLGVRTVFLWVLDGNDGATRLYKRLGFASCNNRQALEARPGRSEELMQLDLGPA